MPAPNDKDTTPKTSINKPYGGYGAIGLSVAAPCTGVATAIITTQPGESIQGGVVLTSYLNGNPAADKTWLMMLTGSSPGSGGTTVYTYQFNLAMELANSLDGSRTFKASATIVSQDIIEHQTAAITCNN